MRYICNLLIFTHNFVMSIPPGLVLWPHSFGGTIINCLVEGKHDATRVLQNLPVSSQWSDQCWWKLYMTNVLTMQDPFLTPLIIIRLIRVALALLSPVDVRLKFGQVAAHRSCQCGSCYSNIIFTSVWIAKIIVAVRKKQRDTRRFCATPVYLQLQFLDSFIYFGSV